MIPDFLKHLATYGEYPVPITVMWIDGKPDFRVIDFPRVVACVQGKFCGVCGFKLGPDAYFVGGEKTIKYRLFTDPPMHEECAVYSVQLCPYLNGTDRTYSTREVKCPHSTRELVSMEVSGIFMMKASSELTRFVKYGDDTLIQAGQWLEVKEMQCPDRATKK